MKNIIALLLIIAFGYSCTNQNTEDYNFTITGTIIGEYSGLVYLYNRESGEWIKLDSVQVENNTYKFKGTIDLPEVYYLSVDDVKGFASVFTEKSEINVTSDLNDFKNPVISGSSAQRDYESYTEKNSAYKDQLGEIWSEIKAARENSDRALETELEEKYDSVDGQLKQHILDYAKQNNTSVVGAYVVMRNAYYYDENDLDPVVSNFDESISNSVYVKNLKERVATLKSVAVGQPAVNFTMTDIDGNDLVLSSLYGKYLLVDFWASWCGPCRRENPNVVAAYKKFSDKGFDILGVSFDKDNDKWVDAVNVDNLTWHHVSDLKGWGNEAGKLYAVNSIPANILLDPEGKIIAKNLREEALLTKLAELLGE